MTAKSSFSDGSTCKTNYERERPVEIANGPGRVGGSRCGFFICTG